MNKELNKERARIWLRELAFIAKELNESSHLTEQAIKHIESKLNGTSTDSDDWKEFINKQYIRCMNSKNARRHEGLYRTEYLIWREFLNDIYSPQILKTSNFITYEPTIDEKIESQLKIEYPLSKAQILEMFNQGPVKEDENDNQRT